MKDFTHFLNDGDQFAAVEADANLQGILLGGALFNRIARYSTQNRSDDRADDLSPATTDRAPGYTADSGTGQRSGS